MWQWFHGKHRILSKLVFYFYFYGLNRHTNFWWPKHKLIDLWRQNFTRTWTKTYLETFFIRVIFEQMAIYPLKIHPTNSDKKVFKYQKTIKISIFIICIWRNLITLLRIFQPLVSWYMVLCLAISYWLNKGSCKINNWKMCHKMT